MAFDNEFATIDDAVKHCVETKIKSPRAIIRVVSNITPSGVYFRLYAVGSIFNKHFPNTVAFVLPGGAVFKRSN